MTADSRGVLYIAPLHAMAPGFVIEPECCRAGQVQHRNLEERLRRSETCGVERRRHADGQNKHYLTAAVVGGVAT